MRNLFCQKISGQKECSEFWPKAECLYDTGIIELSGTG